MGTEFNVVLSGGAGCTRFLSSPINAELRRVNESMSTWQPDSEVARFNTAPAGEWMDVSIDLLEIARLSQTLARKSEGAFDITAGPLVELWGFGPGQRRGIPGALEIETAAARVGHTGLRIRHEPPALLKIDEGLRLDLSAIAKGYGVDRLADLLDANGCTDYLIEIGGEVRVRGTNPQGGAWRVGVEMPAGVAPDVERAGIGGNDSSPPADPMRRWSDKIPARAAGAAGEAMIDRDFWRVVHLADAAVATSGDYRNLRRVGDIEFSHTIDPRTGYPVTHRLASVTVVAETAALADGLATLINVLGPEDGLAFAEREEIAALLFMRDEGGYEQRYTEAMRKYFDLPAGVAAGLAD